jgi:malonyl CoA-acyl carrier protein transacylase
LHFPQSGLIIASISGGYTAAPAKGVVSMSKKNDLSEKLEPVEEMLSKAAVVVGEAAKEAVKAAEPTVKEAKKHLKKAAKAAEPTVIEAKKQLKRAADAAEPTVKAAQKKLAAAGKKASAALIPEVYIQWGSHESSCAELVERAKQDYRADHQNVILSCKLYVKPEDGCAYYVINDAAGKVDL